MTETVQANEALETRRRQAMDRMDRNDSLIREARAGRIADVIDEADVVSRVAVADFFARESEQE